MHDINSESATKADIEKRNESYNAYVKNVTPKGSCVAKCFKAFLVGGCICVAGQIILNVCKWMKVPDTGGVWRGIRSFRTFARKN